jgi:hypothetical protein
VTAQDIPALHPASRVYYGIIHPIQYNVKVKEIGYVPKNDVHTVIGNWKAEDDSDTEQSAEVTNTAEIPEDDEEDEDEEEKVSSAKFQRTGGMSYASGSAGYARAGPAYPPTRTAYTQAYIQQASLQTQGAYATTGPTYLPTRTSHTPAYSSYTQQALPHTQRTRKMDDDDDDDDTDEDEHDDD